MSDRGSMTPSELLALQDRRYDLYTKLMSIEEQLSQTHPRWAHSNGPSVADRLRFMRDAN